MSRETALAALQTLTDEEADILNSDPELLNRFRVKHGLGQPKPSMVQNLSREISRELAPQSTSPQTLIQNISPSNVLKSAGVASANAPGLTSLIANAIPGMGNPAEIPMAIKDIQKRPGQVKKAVQRILETGRGAEYTPKEKIPARIGQFGGMALEAGMMPAVNTSGIKASGPFTAGMKSPSTAFPGSFQKAADELNVARVAARVGEDSAEAARLRVMLQKPAQVVKLAEEAKKATEVAPKALKEFPIVKLEAYKHALGQAMESGGPLANDYAIAKKVVNKALVEKAPDLVSKVEKMATNFAARGNPKAGFPFLITAVNPAAGAAKASTLPVVRNLAGAITGTAIQRTPAVANAINTPVQASIPAAPLESLKPLLKKIAKKYLKNALKETNGDLEQARILADERAKKDGYDTSVIK